MIAITRMRLASSWRTQSSTGRTLQYLALTATMTPTHSSPHTTDLKQSTLDYLVCTSHDRHMTVAELSYNIGGYYYLSIKKPHDESTAEFAELHVSILLEQVVS